MKLKINKTSGLNGSVKVPGDKSISHRSLMLGAMAEGKTRVTGFLPSADCLSTLNCLSSLGVEIKRLNPIELMIKGVGLKGFKEACDVLNVENSGTTMRILSGVLAGQNFFSVLSGDDSLRKRPMKRIIEPLRLMGADIWARGKGTRAPIAIMGRPLKGISYETPIPSAQVKSCILLAGLLADGKTCIKEKAKSRDHTERMLKFLGADIEVKNNEICIQGGSKLKGAEVRIPGDFSSASFLLVAALLAGDSEITIENVGVNPTRMGLLNILLDMGARVKLFNEKVLCGEPSAEICVKSSILKGVTIGGDIIPKIVDELPIFAVAATQAEGTTLVKDAKELRFKETDRIKAICSELKKMGADIEEFEDGFAVHGPNKLKGCVCSSFGDHRMAMALAVAGLFAEGTTIIEDSECIDISFPGFRDILSSLTKEAVV